MWRVAGLTSRATAAAASRRVSRLELGDSIASSDGRVESLAESLKVLSVLGVA